MILIKGWADRRVQRNETLLCCPTPILTKDYSTEISSISVIITSPNAIAAFPSEPDIPESIPRENAGSGKNAQLRTFGMPNS
ncbi:hypothetical protein [Sphingomonas sp. PP-CE-1A-559]|uniref:hypothetical protein n=1 Tax=Sphingomonas sp. PP-CE-1A-559 TaxID=2135657 RepID=UPI001056CBCC|nr:hypothetical protein [Sphingomonas sp. PP-CE-1A-559]